MLQQLTHQIRQEAVNLVEVLRIDNSSKEGKNQMSASERQKKEEEGCLLLSAAMRSELTLLNPLSTRPSGVTS